MSICRPPPAPHGKSGLLPAGVPAASNHRDRRHTLYCARGCMLVRRTRGSDILPLFEVVTNRARVDLDRSSISLRFSNWKFRDFVNHFAFNRQNTHAPVICSHALAGSQAISLIIRSNQTNDGCRGPSAETNRPEDLLGARCVTVLERYSSPCSGPAQVTTASRHQPRIQLWRRCFFIPVSPGELGRRAGVRCCKFAPTSRLLPRYSCRQMM